MTPHLLVADPEVVTPFHQHIMRVVGEAERAYGDIDLRLEGGTALSAYHLRHRESEDLDFFAGVQIDVRDWLASLTPRLEAAGCPIRMEREAIASFATIYVGDAHAPDRPPIKVQFARTSPYRLAPLDLAEEGVRVGSRRDLFRGKLEAICGRTVPRDFIDLHQMVWRPHSDTEWVTEDEARRGFRALIRDLFDCDPGLTVPYVAQCLAKARARMPMVSQFPLRLLKPTTDADVLGTVELCVDECAAMLREGL